MGYNTTNLTNASNLGSVYVSLNTLSNGVLSIALLVTVFVIVFVSVRDDPRKAFAAASFINLLLGGVLLAGGMISSFIMYVLVFLLAVSLVLLWVQRDYVTG